VNGLWLIVTAKVLLYSGSFVSGLGGGISRGGLEREGVRLLLLLLLLWMLMLSVHQL
jgi:hypothetical protein